MRMRLVKIMDTQGWGQPVEIARLLVPSDWKTEGGAYWQSDQLRCPLNIIQIRFRAWAPDLSVGFEVFPTYAWAWSDDAMTQQTTRAAAQNGTGCDAYPVMNPAQFLSQMVVPKARPGAKVVAAEPLPAVAAVAQQRLNASYGQSVQAGLLRGVRAESGRVRIAGAYNGQPYEEWINATINTIAAPSANSQMLMNGQMNMNANLFSIVATDVYAVHAARGKLDENARLFATIVASIQVNPRYTAAVGQFLAGIQRQINIGNAERAKIWRDAQDSISASIKQTYEENQRVQDKMAEQFGQTIRGVETYVDPRTNERVELNSGYAGAWTNGKGEYLLTESPGVDPSVELQENWHRLERPPSR